MALQLPYFGPFITLGVYFGLLFLTSKMRNSAGGIVCVFALTGFMGLTLGPLLNAYLAYVPNGGELVMTALGAIALTRIQSLPSSRARPRVIAMTAPFDVV